MAGIGSVWTMARLSSRLLGLGAAIFTTGLVALSFNQIAYSQELSKYAFAPFLTLLALLCIAWPGEEFRWKWAGMTALVWFVSPVVLYCMLFPLTSISVVWIILWLRQPNRSREELLKWLAIQAAGAASGIPIYFTFLRYQIAQGVQRDYLTHAYWDRSGLGSLLALLVHGAWETVSFSYSFCPLMFLMVLAGAMCAARDRHGRILLSVFIGTAGLTFIGALLRAYPFDGERHTMYLTVFIYLFAGFAFARILSSRLALMRMLAIALSAIFCLVGARSTLMYIRFTGDENIKGAGAYLFAHVQPNDGIAIQTLAEPQVFVHLPSLIKYAPDPNANPMDSVFHEDDVAWTKYLTQNLMTHSRLWIIFSHSRESSQKAALDLVSRTDTLGLMFEDKGTYLYLAQKKPGA